jgi:nicotinate-nucleotide pyrophosphorylase (carboxylating)
VDIPTDAIRDAVRRALAEDVGAGDLTTNAVVPPDAVLRAFVVYREPAVVAGLPVMREVYAQLGVADQLDESVLEGTRVAAGETAAVIEAPAAAVLTGERVALNFLQRLSGVATRTRAFVDAVRGTRATILDTRKTTPGLRALEKYAVRMGGGTNHRMGLFDAILIKDNHIAAAGGLEPALRRARAAVAADVRVQVEVDRVEDLESAIRTGADWILLDNLAPAQVAQAVRRVGGRVPLEASGGITLESLRAYAETGVDYISSGDLTHSAPAIDIGLDVQAWT